MSEALQILVGDVIDDDHDTKTLHVRGDKRGNAKSDGMQELYPKLLDEDAATFLLAIMKKKKHGEAIFGHMRPKYIQVRYKRSYEYQDPRFKAFLTHSSRMGFLWEVEAQRQRSTTPSRGLCGWTI